MKRLEFREEKDVDDNEFYVVYNKKNQVVGWITHEHWNRWTWDQQSESVMSRGCLREVFDFMEALGGKP